jgi:hypothetical protein
MSELALIYCKPSYLDSIKELGLDWTHADNNGTEIVVTVKDVPYEIVDGFYQDPDEQLCEHYGIDYDEVNCIEAA